MEAVFLDAGGVLTRLEAPRAALFREAGLRLGHPVSLSTAEALFAALRRLRATRRPLLLEDYPRFHREALAQGAEITGLGDDYLAVWKAYRQLLQEPRYRSPFSDAKPTLATLREAGLCLGVISNAATGLVPLLEGFGLASSFDAILASEAVGYAKPQPEMFREALRALGVAAEDAVHVGDSYPYDYLGATRAGLRAILLDREGTAEADVPRIGSLAVLPRALDLEAL